MIRTCSPLIRNFYYKLKTSTLNFLRLSIYSSKEIKDKQGIAPVTFKLPSINFLASNEDGIQGI